MKLKYMRGNTQGQVSGGKVRAEVDGKVLRVPKSQRGVSLMETVTALGIMSFVGLAVIAGVSTSIKSNEMARTHISAESLARSELEYVSRQPYTTTAIGYTLTSPDDSPVYPDGWDATHTMPEGYTGYTITVSSNKVYVESTIQKLTAVVSYTGDEVLTIETYQAQY
jgi:Tfp pilus assembly protein PilV